MTAFACCSVIQFADGAIDIYPLAKGTLDECERVMESIDAVAYGGEREDVVGARVAIIDEISLKRLQS